MIEKTSMDKETLLEGLRNEEANLMQKVAGFMSGGTKTASQQQSMDQTEQRLQQVRAKITELDTK